TKNCCGRSSTPTAPVIATTPHRKFSSTRRSWSAGSDNTPALQPEFALRTCPPGSAIHLYPIKKDATNMDHQITEASRSPSHRPAGDRVYETPAITDYGTLPDLTQAAGQVGQDSLPQTHSRVG